MKKAQHTLVKLALVLAMALFSEKIMAQDPVTPAPEPADSTEVEKKVKPPVKHSMGIFLSVSLENRKHPGGREFLPFYCAGVEYDGFLAGVFSTYFSGDVHQRLIFPNDFNLIYSYGGGYLGRRVFSTEEIEIDLLMSYARGNMLWERADTYLDFIEDRFVTLEPELSIAYKPIAPVRFYGTVGYRKMTGLNLAQVDPSDLEGVTINLGFKVGLYRKKTR